MGALVPSLPGLSGQEAGLELDRLLQRRRCQMPPTGHLKCSLGWEGPAPAHFPLQGSGPREIILSGRKATGRAIHCSVEPLRPRPRHAVFPQGTHTNHMCHQWWLYAHVASVSVQCQACVPACGAGAGRLAAPCVAHSWGWHGWNNQVVDMILGQEGQDLSEQRQLEGFSVCLDGCRIRLPATGPARAMHHAGSHESHLRLE